MNVCVKCEMLVLKVISNQYVLMVALYLKLPNNY